MKGSLGTNISYVFSRCYFMILFYMLVLDLMCDKDLKQLYDGFTQVYAMKNYGAL